MRLDEGKRLFWVLNTRMRMDPSSLYRIKQTSQTNCFPRCVYVGDLLGFVACLWVDNKTNVLLRELCTMTFDLMCLQFIIDSMRLIRKTFWIQYKIRLTAVRKSCGIPQK